MENTGAVSPAHPVPSTPQAAYPGLQRRRGPSAPLTCLAWPAAWQSLCTRHLDASLKLSALTFTEPGPPRAEASRHLGQTARERSPFYRQRGRVANTDRRGSVSPNSSEQSRSGRERRIRTLRGGNLLPSREWGLWQKPQEGVSKRHLARGPRILFSAAGWTCPKAIAGRHATTVCAQAQEYFFIRACRIGGRHSCALTLLSIV